MLKCSQAGGDMVDLWMWKQLPSKSLEAQGLFIKGESKPHLCKFRWCHVQLCNDNRIAHCMYWRATGILFSANFYDSTYHSKIPYQSLPIRVVILCQGWLMGILSFKNSTRRYCFDFPEFEAQAVSSLRVECARQQWGLLCAWTSSKNRAILHHFRELFEWTCLTFAWLHHLEGRRTVCSFAK